MSSIYVFCLVLAGAFLLVSMLGDLFDAGSDLDLDMDLDVDADAAGILEMDAGGDAGDALDAGQSTHATKILSIRTLIYALFGFGAVGTVLSLRGEAGALETVLWALTGGVLTGGLVTLVFNWLRSTDMQDRAGDQGFIGLTGSVVLPLRTRAPGSIAVERAGRRVTLRALPHTTGESDVSEWSSVVIVDMEDGTARVAPFEEELAEDR